MPHEIATRIEERKAVLANNLIKWALKNSPEYPWRKTSDPYHIMVSEMLLRRTRASSVTEVYKNFITKFPTVFSLARSDVKEVEKTIQSLGMKSRASLMKSVAKTIAEKQNGKFPSKESELLEIIGKGSRYAVNAIRCFGLGEKVPIFDVNVKRIFERVFSVQFEKDAHKKIKSWEIVSHGVPENNVKQYNWALLDLGKSICTPSDPKCQLCPLKTICDYASRRV